MQNQWPPLSLAYGRPTLTPSLFSCTTCLGTPASVTPDTILREQVKLVSSLEAVGKNRGKFFIPPIPRFVFGSCCTNTIHGNNTMLDTHKAHAINEHTRQHHTIIKSLNSTGITNHKVIDIMQSLREGPNAKANRLTCLKRFMHRDNIHLTADGYARIAAGILPTTQQLTTRPRVQGGTPRGIEVSGWQGFVTTTGYGSVSRATPPPPARGRGMRHHPYRRH